VAASYEDFGLTPIEAGSFGTPTVALRFGGYLDTVVEGRTGTFFDEPSPGAIADALRALDQLPLDPEVIRRESARFDEQHFARRLLQLSGLPTDDAGSRSPDGHR
jgi:glycosyltransferase involved in cell wall biosynthesis